MKKDIYTDAFDTDSMFEHLKSRKIINCFLLDIDNFSNINNAFGYQVGNEILNTISKHLNRTKPFGSTLYRYHSDTFIILDENHLSRSDILEIVNSISSFFSEIDIKVDQDTNIRISFTIGISTAIGSINITQAEMAHNEAKENGKYLYHIFDPTSKFVYNKQRNIYWIHKIQEAIRHGDIIAYYQPIHDNKAGKIAKYECLARLKDDDKIISPFLFMEAAKLTGNLSAVTKYLITHSFEMFSSNDLTFSINITGDDLSQNYLETFLTKMAKKFNIKPSRVILEMLEDITSLDDDKSQQQLLSLRERGYKIAMDDFGAENSNFYKILEFQPDFVKIDGMFIKNILEDKISYIITKTIVNMCKESNIQIIAEYVHNKKIQALMIELGIDFSQGYYFGVPSASLLCNIN